VATTEVAQELPLLYLQLLWQTPSFTTCSCSSARSGTCRNSARHAYNHVLGPSDAKNVSRRATKPKLSRKTTPPSFTVPVMTRLSPLGKRQHTVSCPLLHITYPHSFMSPTPSSSRSFSHTTKQHIPSLYSNRALPSHLSPISGSASHQAPYLPRFRALPSPSLHFDCPDGLPLDLATYRTPAKFWVSGLKLR
jgi:hypothetical protein